MDREFEDIFTKPLGLDKLWHFSSVLGLQHLDMRNFRGSGKEERRRCYCAAEASYVYVWVHVRKDKDKESEWELEQEAVY